MKRRLLRTFLCLVIVATLLALASRSAVIYWLLVSAMTVYVAF